MLGHRGCRLGISFPEIYEMQCRAIFEALSDLKKNKQKFAFPEIMIPLGFYRSRNKNYERFSN